MPLGDEIRVLQAQISSGIMVHALMITGENGAGKGRWHVCLQLHFSAAIKESARAENAVVVFGHIITSILI